MIKEAIEKIIEIYGPKTINIIGYDNLERVYSGTPLHLVTAPSPKALLVSSLTGFCDYLNQLPPGEKEVNYFRPDYVLIESPTVVSALTSIEPVNGKRMEIIKASCRDYNFKFDFSYDLESFIIGLQSCFGQTEDINSILKVVSAIKVNKGTLIQDDGVSQSVQAQTGISRIANVKLPNPVSLKPFRTFLEINQPQSEFVFRVSESNGDVRCRLIEADGGAWTIESMASIKDYLQKNLKSELGLTIIS